MHRSGFVNIIGNPNVGKSTLMNALLGEKLSIITSKAQTTRHRIMGILNGDDYQLVLSDTPGIMDPAYKMQESMMGFVNLALTDADLFLVVTEPGEKAFNVPGVVDKVKKSGVPVMVLINKIDLFDQDTVQARFEEMEKEFEGAFVIGISALKNFNVNGLLSKLIEALPEGPAYFPKDQASDKTLRFFMSEIIREKIFLHYKQEIPYSVEVEIESFKEEEDLVRVSAIIYVARDSQKGIVIGHKGSALKRVGTEARKDMERFLDKKVFLETHVKVNKDWRNKNDQLRRFGYSPS